MYEYVFYYINIDNSLFYITNLKNKPNDSLFMTLLILFLNMYLKLVSQFILKM